MKRARRRHSPSPVARKRHQPLLAMPESNKHPKLNHLVNKTDRRNLCEDLIADIVESLAPAKPSLRSVRCGHRVTGPILDRGKKNILTAGQYRQHCIGDDNTFLRCPPIYLTGPIGLDVLREHPDFPTLYACLQELAPTPRKSLSSGSITSTNSMNDPPSSPSPASQSQMMAAPPLLIKPFTVAKMSTGSKAPHREVQSAGASSNSSVTALPACRFVASLDDHPHASELDASIPVTIILYLKNGQPPKRVRAFADKGSILTLSDFKMALGEAGLDLGAGGQVLESYHKHRWMTISSETPNRVTKGGILAVRLEGVEDMYNWEIDQHYID